jgi:Ca-activated chloride channel family protein
MVARMSRRCEISAIVAALMMVAAGGPGAALRAGQQDKAGVKLFSDLVLVNVTVTDLSGKYVHGLSASDFSVSEDGARQKIESFAAEEAPFAAAILLDMSASMEPRFGLARAAAATFIEQIRDDDQVAVYGFNRKVTLLQNFSNARTITDYIWDAKAEDNTRLYDCIDAGVEALARRPERRRAIVLISDGWDTMSQRASFDSALKKALAAGITIYSVDLVNDELLSGSYLSQVLRSRRELEEFARQTGGRYIRSPRGENLEEIFAAIVEELRNQYTLAYYSTNDRRDGRWRALQVAVSKPGLLVRARRGYYAPKD